MKSIYDILLAPVSTEKAYGAGNNSDNKTYTFLVDLSANKFDIKRAVEDVFNVKVKKVNVLNRKGKNKNRRGVKGQLADRRYAIVTLAEGSISLEGGF
jgi:large subunit ribosomal protein L23